jgi:drug/metabolite transporter (DMT)-like permease
VSLAVAVPLGVASATVYGASIVAQHRAAQDTSASSGTANATGLRRLLRDPRWLLSMCGDFVGFLLQIAALSTGAVVYVQPLVVLMLPVALLVGSLTGGPRPRAAGYLASLSVVAGLGAFLALIGRPGEPEVPQARYLLMTVGVELVVGAVLFLAVGRCGRLIRGAVCGAVAGALFGTLGVFVDALSDVASADGVHALVGSGRGLALLAGILVLGGGGILLTQVSFQVGALAATLPASLATDPLTGVLLGALLLNERIPFSPAHLVGYSVCYLAVIAGVLRLATLPDSDQRVGSAKAGEVLETDGS